MSEPEINFQTRICPTCHDDHSSERACDINDLLQIKEVREIYEAPMKIVLEVYDNEELYPWYHKEAEEYRKVLNER